MAAFWKGSRATKPSLCLADSRSIVRHELPTTRFMSDINSARAKCNCVRVKGKGLGSEVSFSLLS